VIRTFRLDESQGRLTGVSRLDYRAAGHGRNPLLAVGAAARANLLAYGGAERIVYVCDSNNMGRHHAFRELTDDVYAVAVSPDGGLVAAACRDGGIRLWNTRDGKLLTIL
jgi:WD40 repeat protein